jgi:hypothetical protein
MPNANLAMVEVDHRTPIGCSLRTTIPRQVSLPANVAIGDAPRWEQTMTLRWQVQIPRQHDAALFPTIKSIVSLRDVDQHENEDSVAPSEAAIAHAIMWIGSLYEYLAYSESTWIPPLISDSADGGVMFEWWNHEYRRKLTVYIWDQRTEYVQVWGPDMVNEMAEGQAEPIGAFDSVWAWLIR